MFMEFQKRSGQPEADAFREGLELAEAADAWGLDEAWLAEFHFSPGRSVLSSPIVLASAIASRTSRLRIGMAVYVLPLNNPLRIAEEVATVDQLSGGRFDLGVGRSGFTQFYRGYGIDYAESQRRFEETMQILERAWSGEPFSFDGEFFQFTDVRVCPRPFQKPHPPMRMAATNTATFKRVGSRGLPVFVGLRGDDIGQLAASLEGYRAAWREGAHPGNGSAYLRVPIYVGADGRSAREEVRECLTYYFERQSKLVANDAASRRAAPGGAGDRAETAAALARLDYEDILATRAAVGSPQGVIERLTEWRDVLGLDGVVAELNAGGLLSEDQVLGSLGRLTREVMPAFK